MLLINFQFFKDLGRRLAVQFQDQRDIQCLLEIICFIDSLIE